MIILFGSAVAYAVTVTTFATVGTYSQALAFDSADNLYVVTVGSGTISKITPSGIVSTFASSLNSPEALAFDSSGNLYVANRGAYGSNGTISKITPSGSVTLAWATVGSGPSALAFDSSGNLYVANTSGTTISKITPSGSVTLAWATVGTNPEALAFDSSGNLYVANAGSGTISKITPSGSVTLAWATVGSFPVALAFDSSGNLYVANEGSGTISKITPSGIVSTFASGFNTPYSLAFDSSGNLYVANRGSGTISKITLNSSVTLTWASVGTNPEALAFDSADNLYVVNEGSGTISKITFPTKPTATITSSLGANMQVGQTSTIQSVATPGSGDTITNTEITQSFNAGAQTNDGSSASATTTYSFSTTTPGTYIFYGNAETTAYSSWYNPPGASIVVTVTNPPPTCAITLTPNPIDASQSATLSWTTTNSPQWLLINNVGYMSTSTSSGSFTVTPSSTTDYTCTVADASNNQYSFPANATLTVYQLPMCTLAVAPSSIIRGNSATLTYFSQNVTSFSISPSIGTVTQNATATASVSPTTSTTYAGSASGPGGSASCTIPTNSTSTLAVSCNAATSYSCNGLSTIVQTSTSTSCAVTTNNSYGTCSSPGFCLAGDSTCYYTAPDPVPTGNQSGNLTLHPILIPAGKPVTVYWDIQTGTALNCSVSGTNNDGTPQSTDTASPGAWNTLAGPETTSPIEQQTIYTLSCLQDDGVTHYTQTASVNVVPSYQER
jgi:sugar lactone lactonase YvrE